MLAYIGRAVKARILQEYRLHFLAHLHANGQIALVGFKDGEGFGPNLERRMSERHCLAGLGKSQTDLAKIREDLFLVHQSISVS
jgi:hypothetical protein